MVTSRKAYIQWDENVPDVDIDPARWSRQEKERNSDLLFFVVYFELPDVQCTGLILRMQPNPKNGAVYVRMGRFSSSFGWQHGNEDDPDTIIAKLGLLSENYIVKDIDLDDSRLSGLVHTVTIV